MPPPAPAPRRAGRRGAEPRGPGLSSRPHPGINARRRPTLRLTSHNVRCLTLAKLELLLASWTARRRDVVCLQETKTTLVNCVALEAAAAAAGWRVYWAHAGPLPTTAAAPAGAPAEQLAGRRSGGAAIFVRHHSLGRGLEVEGDAWRHDADTGRGRLLSLRLRWGGHRLRLFNVYMPNEETAQRRFLAGPVAAAVALAQADGAGVKQVWLGDYNFVERPASDRFSTRDPAGSSALAEQRTARRWQQAAAQPIGLVDAYRHRRPAGRRYTHFWRRQLATGAVARGAARLDRSYISRGLLEWTVAASMGDEDADTATLSDHRPIHLELLPRTGPSCVASKAAPRLRLRFLACPELLQHFKQQVEALAATAPPGQRALLDWWPSFKRRLLRMGASLDKAARRQLPQSVRDTWVQLQQAYDAVEAAADGARPEATAAAMDRVMELREHLAAATTAARAEGAAQQRRAWLHSGERPCPHLTTRLSPPKDARAITALEAPNGSLVSTPTGCANLLVHSYAAVSAQPATEPAAQAAVLDALAGGARPTAEEAAILGASVVTAQQVAKAAKRSRPGRAPGGDGIPLALYKHPALRPIFYPLLARLYTAVGAEERTPPGFLDGVISVLHKKGDRSKPINYRPITLLNTDYRLLAKLLADRLAPLLPQLIDPEQTGFIRGRCIGENIHLLQLLPRLLARQGRWAVAACLDIAKAYDTVDRAFLFAAAQRLGLGDGFVRWMRLLLTSTRAQARVAGHLSAAAPFLAGVRQGCPLAPLLYLLVALALLRLLKQQGFGVQVGTQRITASQFADDCNVLLQAASMQELAAEVQRFLAAMDLFQRATGQALSVDKTVLLPLGQLPPDLLAPACPAAIGGLKVVSESRVLGVTLRAGLADPVPTWEVRLKRVRSCHARIAGLGLSAFGRAFASNGYAVSQLLFQAEFAGLPPRAELDTLLREQARLVDTGLPPSGTTAPQAASRGSAPGPRRFTHIRKALLPGRPERGGFGLLPLVEHCHARWAAWLFRLVTGDGLAPWAAVAAELISLLQPGLTPLGLLAFSASTANRHRLPQPLRRWCEGAAALPPAALLDAAAVAAARAAVGDADAAVPSPPGWHAALPIMYSPLIQLPADQGGGCLADAYHTLAVDAGVATLGDLLRLQQAVRALSPPLLLSRSAWRHRVAELLGDSLAIFFAGAYRVEPWEAAEEHLAQVLACVPMQLRLAALAEMHEQQRGQLELPSTASVEAFVAQQLGWQRVGHPLLLARFRVRHGTAMQLEAQQETRRTDKLLPYVRLALAGSTDAAVTAAELAAGETSLLGLLRRAWRLPWDNHLKVTLWRLVQDGLPVQARMPGSGAEACGCGATATPAGGLLDRGHHFWVCPVARAVVASVEAQLPLEQRPLPRRALWLGEAPAGVHAGIWTVVCLAALEAMERARALVRRRQREHQEQQALHARQAAQVAPLAGQRTLQQAADGRIQLGPPHSPGPAAEVPEFTFGPAQAQRLGARAVEWLWGLLQECCALGVVPEAWKAEALPGHPFLSWHEQPSGWRTQRV